MAGRSRHLGARLPMGGRLAATLCLILGACQMVGPAAAGPSVSGQMGPVLSPGDISRAEDAEASRLYRSAEGSFEDRRFLEVLRTTTDLMERFPSASVSGAALLLSARAEFELGAAERADAAAERYLDLLPPGDARSTEVRLLQVAVWEGRPDLQLDRLLRIDSSAQAEELASAVPLMRAVSDSLDAEELEAILATAPSDGPLAPIPQVLLAVNLLDQGDAERASRLARTALQGGAGEPERGVAEGVLRGELPPGRARVTSFTIGMVLPSGGPPALSEFSRRIAEGIEVAVATVLPQEYVVTLTSRDDEANPALSALLASELEIEGALGAVGFLEDDALLAAGQSRIDGLPLVSPTARTAASAGEGVYSLEGSDPIAAVEIARYAVSRAYQRVAIIMPSNAAAIEEADAFEAEAARFGVPVVERFYYEPGATFFETQVIGARDVLRRAEIAALGLGEEDTLRVEMLEPVGIFLPIPREDVEFLAPQVAHFALDTLAIELLGTSAWTDPGVLEVVEPIYLNGVVATVPVGVGPFSPGQERFRAAYEEHFQRTLVSTTPALGYDAALLLLEALRPGRVGPAEVRESFRGLRDIEGATGIFSIIDDRVVRRTEVVRIRNRSLDPVPPL
jgi:ABC-type branched-subunit amino acid transport system substrate-binding protein